MVEQIDSTDPIQRVVMGLLHENGQPVHSPTAFGALRYIITHNFHNVQVTNVFNKTSWTIDQWSPRLGLIWTPVEHHTLRQAGF